MVKKHTGWIFNNDNGEFSLDNPDCSNFLYFPLANEAGIMSAITPTLHGDIKTGQNNYLTAPVTSLDLNNTRSAMNFWVYTPNKAPWSLAGNSPRQIEDRMKEVREEEVKLEAGFLYHKIIRKNNKLGLKSEIINFVPVENDKVELMKVSITNLSDETISLNPTAAIPIYARSADNIRDHRHVTSLLNRAETTEYGVLVKPTLSFDERGHKKNNVTYYVLGAEDNGEAPVGFLADMEEYIGESGNLEWPEAIVKNSLFKGKGQNTDGYEAIGAIRFNNIDLKKGEEKNYILAFGVNFETDLDIKEKYLNLDKFNNELEKNKNYWGDKLSTLSFESGDNSYDNWMKWVTLQPILRRIYGCSFLPHHDYGRGGRGWRDLWQDLLALLIMEPKQVRELLLNNYSGVRIDGTNATIIGSKPGEFLADRNNIPRVWMDHGAWPFLTTKLYLDQSGDLDFLLEEQDYFKDGKVSRCLETDESFDGSLGNRLRDVNGNKYTGTILEHILVENLSSFFNVGDHNNIKLESADWNDGLDMASAKGESVAFTALYGSNILDLSKILLKLKQIKNIESVYLAEEIIILLDSISGQINYQDVAAKKDLLNKYYEKTKNSVSGVKIEIDIEELACDLSRKGQSIIEHIRENELVVNKEGYEWFNGYYDNNGKQVEGDNDLGTRMILTSQVFTIMGGVAEDDQVKKIVSSCDKYLKDLKVGGYRLNTNFNEVKLDMGRLFGFAFGHKENGAMFSHMAIMYGNALYKRGFVKEGYEVINSIYTHCSDFEKSRIYPGIPEYINEKGRGMYNYLTGSASWLLLTVLNEIYGVKGELGDLIIEPKLLKQQFDKNKQAKVTSIFKGKNIKVSYKNESLKDYGEYKISKVLVNEKNISINQGEKVVIGKDVLEKLDIKDTININVELS
ncbi:MAG: GH36-type glycosyl hydrolase domain-containing protein [Clostridiaceae bacterium]